MPATRPLDDAFEARKFLFYDYDNRREHLLKYHYISPAGNIVDIRKWADIAHAAGVPLIVDNTVATPVLCRVFDHGAQVTRSTRLPAWSMTTTPMYPAVS